MTSRNNRAHLKRLFYYPSFCLYAHLGAVFPIRGASRSSSSYAVTSDRDSVFCPKAMFSSYAATFT